MHRPAYPVLPHDTAIAPRIDLCGDWTYAQPVTDPFAATPLPSGAVLSVPGEVVMQSLPYDPLMAFAVERVLTIPNDWAGKAIRLCFESVYSACRVFVDGQVAGSHLGGFTPFDLDITHLAPPGSELRITLHVDNYSLADTIANGSKYAAHPLAGLHRKATLYALPPRHIQNLGIRTLFADGTYDAARLEVDFVATEPGEAELTLISPTGERTHLVTAGVEGRASFACDVLNPLLWDTEQPSLYTIEIAFGAAVYSKRIGFREIATTAGKLLLNGQPIIVRGVNHHETHPATGRADTARWARTDVELLRAAHVNLFRTSHYPPTIELVEACDELGMLLEVEAPVCFAFGQFGHMPLWEEHSDQQREAMTDYVVGATLEMVEYLRAHPSIAIWSIGNESRWAPPFEASAAAIRALDPTRPLTFNWYKLKDGCRDHVDIANHHYPDAADMPGFALDPRPVLFGEFGHLYCYNGNELATDPGLRQRWGDLFARQWKQILELPNGIGGSIWASHDDYFAVPQPDGTRKWVGYGEWGPLDGWRRPKPEYEQLKRAYNPIQLSDFDYVSGKATKITVTNRFDFADLDEVAISWAAGSDRGTALLSAGPGQSAVLDIPACHADTLELSFELSRLGFARHFTLRTAPSIDRAVAPAIAAALGDVARLGEWAFRDDGLGPVLLTPQGDAMPLSLLLVPAHPSWQPAQRPALVAPLDNIVSGWRPGGVDLHGTSLRVHGTYEQAKGHFTFTAREDSSVEVAYDFVSTIDLRPFQVGLSFSLPLAWDKLHWRGNEPVEVLPDDHVGRHVGTACASGGQVGSLTAFDRRDWPWIDDQSPYGSNDFRSTKLGVLSASIGSGKGRGVELLSSGAQHVRAYRAREAIRFLVLDYSSEGSERFFESFVDPWLIRPGDTISGAFVFSAKA